MTRIVAVNVRASGDNDKLLRLWRQIESLDCTTLVLSEFRLNSAGATLERQLIADGLAHTSVSDEDPRRGRGVLIASREPFEATRNPAGLSDHSGALLRASFKDLTLYGVYMPQKKEKFASFDYLVEVARMHAARGDRAMAIGDFNTGDDDLDIERNRVTQNQQKKKERFFAHRQFAQLNDVWTDVWRVRHPEAAEYSWYSNRRNGWRIDHVFVSPALRPAVTAADYLHEPRTQGLTDHAALVVGLDLARLAEGSGYERLGRLSEG